MVETQQTRTGKNDLNRELSRPARLLDGLRIIFAPKKSTCPSSELELDYQNAGLSEGNRRQRVVAKHPPDGLPSVMLRTVVERFH